MEAQIQKLRDTYGQRYDQFLLVSTKPYDLKPHLFSKGLYQDLLRALGGTNVDIPA